VVSCPHFEAIEYVMTNKRQTKAIWIFGAAIALVLLLGGYYYIPALAVIGGLVVFGLRTKNKSANVEHSKPTPQKSPIESSPTESSNTVPRDTTPHMFAALIVKRMFANRPPFNSWRPDPGIVPENADAICELYAHAYQLKILLDLILRKFGEPIAMLVEASFRAVTDESMYKDPAKFFGTAFKKIDEGRSLGPVPHEDIPLAEDLRLDARIADQILTIFTEADRPRMRIPLANCLSNARLAAEHVFPELVTDMDFAPSSLADLNRRDYYAGRTCRWSQYPGSFDRHQQRREGNPIFPEEFRNPTNEEIKAARDKDAADFEAAEKATREWIEGVRNLGAAEIRLADIAPYHKSSADVMTLCAQAGGKAETYWHQVESIDKTIAAEIIKAMAKSSPEDAARLREADADWLAMRAISTHPFFAQCGRKGGPITNDEIVPALLCESTQTVQEMVAITKAVMPKETEAWYQQAIVLSDRAKNAKFDIPAIEQKLAILGSQVQAPTPAEYVDLDTLKRDLISRSDDPESIEPLFEELKRKFGDRIPVDQLQQFISAKKANLKSQVKGLVVKAATEGKTISVESLREDMEKAKEQYKGKDREAFNREVDNFVDSLRAQYGDQIPVAEAFKLLQRLERDTGETDTVNQP